MKKQFFLTIAVIAVLAAGVITLSAFSNVKKENPSSGPQCRVVSNVTVEMSFSNGEYKVTASNHNNYRADVAWTATGYRDGKERRAGGGTISVAAGNSKSASFQSTLEDVSLDEVRIYKCDD